MLSAGLGIAWNRYGLSCMYPAIYLSFNVADLGMLKDEGVVIRSRFYQTRVGPVGVLLQYSVHQGTVVVLLQYSVHQGTVICPRVHPLLVQQPQHPTPVNLAQVTL